jgi:hypothetical protein
LKRNNPIIFILGKLQRCREEREKIIREQEIEKPSSARIIDSSKRLFSDEENFNSILVESTHVNDRIASRR